MSARTFVLVWAACLPAAAQSLSSLVSEALKNNREVLAAQKKYEAARQRSAAESAPPDPMVSLGYTSVGSPRPIAGLGTAIPSNAGLVISQEVPFPGKLKLKGEIAAKEADADWREYEAVRRNVVGRLKQAYHTLHHSAVMIRAVQRDQELLSNFIRIAESRYSVGRAAQQDVFRAQAQYAIFEAQLLRARQEREGKIAEILSLLNRPQGGSIEVPDEMPAGSLPFTLEELQQHARTDAPAIQREQDMVERSDLALNLARKQYYPDYTVSGGYFNQGGMPSMYQFRVDVKLPAFWWRKQRAEVAGQAFTASQARRSYEGVRRDIEFRIKDDYVNAETSRRLMDLYQKSVIPQAKLALESSMASYETGQLDFLSLLTNFMTVVDYELNYHEEMMRFHLALARLEELTGLPVDREVTP